VKVDGRLGQVHADTIEAIMYNALDKRQMDGRLQVLVDPFRVRRSVGGGGQYSYSHIWDVLLKDLKRAVIELWIPAQHLKVLGGIIDEIVEIPVTKRDPLTGKGRHFWRVTLGKAWTKLMQEDIRLWYDPEPLADLTNGISQAIARHVLSHKIVPQGGWKLDNLIQIVTGGSGRLRDRRKEVMADAKKLLLVGIVVSNDRVNKASPCEYPPD